MYFTNFEAFTISFRMSLVSVSAAKVNSFRIKIPKLWVKLVILEPPDKRKILSE